ncbi:optic atrophy 3 family protein [Schizosaccharomyces japonicus yFS275]|uniref:Optic atrophy 3 family protein n=1 Tax=Schizosaccharomyces japonicus (strain yFS275 / FY16936) TaxID=402676 RepID=B6K0S8_SCHJY|nr:optic atrophy 3 family protein [Schizosaccharomyces japonicus yFS275]EEB07549.1 optic atrophy 3 family protein [Schizosaccharomyces japonicus yFS275]
MSSLAFKIGSLLVRTLSKPIANTIKSQAKEHPAFRRMCINVAQKMHRAEFRLLGVTKNRAGNVPLHIRPLNDAKAVETGANFLSETFIFSVAGLAILSEYIRAKRKDAARRRQVAETLEGLQDEIVRLNRIVEKHLCTHHRHDPGNRDENNTLSYDFNDLHKVMSHVNTEIELLSASDEDVKDTNQKVLS